MVAALENLLKGHSHENYPGAVQGYPTGEPYPHLSQGENFLKGHSHEIYSGIKNWHRPGITGMWWRP